MVTGGAGLLGSHLIDKLIERGEKEICIDNPSTGNINNINIIHKPLPEDDPMQRNPDISRPKEILNWKPKFDLDMGLNSKIEYFKSVI